MCEKEIVSAAEQNDAYVFYQAHGDEMLFLAGEKNQGEIFYATKAKKDENTGIKYTTLGWKIRVFNQDDILVDTIYYKLGGAHMKTVDVKTVKGYEYCLYRVTLSNMKERMSQAGRRALQNPDCNIVFDACTTTKLNGVTQGGMTDAGPSWGKVYTSYNGIVHAQKWSSATKETLKSYYNKFVEGLFYEVSLEKGEGIRWVKGEGRYCFGTEVTVSAEPMEGYHFADWTGIHNTAKQSFSFVLYDKDVCLTAHAKENQYHILYDANGGEGSIASQTLTYNQMLHLPNGGITLKDATLSGWQTEKGKNQVTYLGGQSIWLKELVHRMKLQYIDGASITLFAKWDHGPVIQVEHIYASLADAKAGRVTEAWLAQRAKAVDHEDGNIPYGHHRTSAFYIENFKESQYRKIQKEAVFEEVFYASDSAGNITRKPISVHIVDTQMYPSDKFTGKVRFISKKYFKDRNNNLISEEMGGLAEDSIWRWDEAYRRLLENLFQ